MTISIYFKKNQVVNIRLQFNNICKRDSKYTVPTTNIQSNDAIGFYPFNLSQESYKNVTVHVFISENLKNIIFDRFKIRLQKENAYINLFIEKRNPKQHEVIVLEYPNPYEENGKNYFAFANPSWHMKAYDKFLKDEKCKNFYIEISRKKFFEKQHRIESNTSL